MKINDLDRWNISTSHQDKRREVEEERLLRKPGSFLLLVRLDE